MEYSLVHLEGMVLLILGRLVLSYVILVICQMVVLIGLVRVMVYGLALMPHAIEVIYLCIILCILIKLFHTVLCPLLSDPINGIISCLLGDDGVPSYEDTCSFTCSIGYILSGSTIRSCQANGSWNGTHTRCTRGM